MLNVKSIEDLEKARWYIEQHPRSADIAVEVKVLSNYVRSDDEHQDRLQSYPNDYCHIPKDVLLKYQAKKK